MCNFQSILQAGNYIKGEVVTIVIQLVSETTSLHAYAVQQLFRFLRTHYTEQPLAQVAAWCIGEYGELLNSQDIEDEEPLQVMYHYINSYYLKSYHRAYIILLI